MDIEENIFEPVDLFRSRFREAHAKNVSDFFEDLLKKSGVDEAKNKDTVSKIKAKQKQISEQSRKVSGKKTLRGFLVFLIVVSLIGAVAFLMGFIDASLVILPAVFSILIIVGCVLLAVLFGLLIGLKINKDIKGLEAILFKLNSENGILIQEAWAEMAPLNRLFDWGTTQSLVSKTIPIIKMDPCFDNDRFECLNQKYGLEDNSDPKRSVLYVQSGEMVGNPFLIAQTMNTWTGSCVYTGTLQISWTETYYENGKWVTRTRYETLKASVTKPMPCFGTETRLIYGNEAALGLSFSRTPSGANGMNEKQIEKFADRKGKEIEKMSEKAVSKGQSFTALAETDFEALFGALNRNDEVQYRLLFTPLAQREMMKIIKDKEVGFGDDFSFVKRNGINIVEPSHLQNVDLSGDPGNFLSYDLEDSRKRFNDYNNFYFKSFYFAFAPILAIPVYQQQKPHEYIYKDIYKSRTSCWEHEYLANQLPVGMLKHPESITSNIVKTGFVSSNDGADRLQVTTYGNKGIPRVDLVSVLGGDGKTHLVSVPWTEYVPVKKTTNVIVERSDDIGRQKVNQLNATSQTWKDFLKSNSASMVYRKAVLAYIALNGVDDSTLGKAGEILKKSE